MSRNKAGKMGRDQTVKNCVPGKQPCPYSGRKGEDFSLSGISREACRAN